MTTTVGRRASKKKAGHSPHTELLRLMLLARGLERQALMIRSAPGPRRASHLRVRGAEAVGVGAASALGTADRLFAPDRYLSAHLCRGLPAENYLLRCLGRREDGPSGNPGSVGYASPGTELIDMAAGAALALQLRGVDGVAMALVPGEAYANGRCAEAVRGSTSRKLPLVVVIEAGPGGELPEAAGEPVDHGDVEAIAAAVRAAADEARSGAGPAFVACGEPAAVRADALVNGVAIDDSVERELKRLACNPDTRRLATRLLRDVADEVAAATRRARNLDFSAWAEPVGAAA